MVAPLSAVKFTVCPATGLPCASVTRACTALVTIPLASALLRVIVRLPSIRVALLASATKVVFTVWRESFTSAVTDVVPAVVLVRVAVATPSAAVSAVGLMVAPLSAVKLTVCPATGLPRASVTRACTALVAMPLASALLRVIVSCSRTISAVSARSWSVISWFFSGSTTICMVARGDTFPCLS